MTFFSTQALGSHLNSCALYKEYLSQSISTTGVVVNTHQSASSSVRVARLVSTVESYNHKIQQQSTASSASASASTSASFSKTKAGRSKDNRSNNRGSSIRTVYSDEKKWQIIEDCENWLSDNEGSTVANYIKSNHLR